MTNTPEDSSTLSCSRSLAAAQGNIISREEYLWIVADDDVVVHATFTGAVAPVKVAGTEFFLT